MDKRIFVVLFALISLLCFVSSSQDNTVLFKPAADLSITQLVRRGSPDRSNLNGENNHKHHHTFHGKALDNSQDINIAGNDILACNTYYFIQKSHSCYKKGIYTQFCSKVNLRGPPFFYGMS